jgi:hypothetical protein
MCFVWISEQTAITFLYSINRSVFVTETESAEHKNRQIANTMYLFIYLFIYIYILKWSD